MAKFLTLYIQNHTLDSEFEPYARRGLFQSWSSRPKLFSKDGLPIVKNDDTIYWVSVKKGVLYLVMAMIVGEIISYEEFSKRYGQDLADWNIGHQKKLFIIAKKATSIEVDRGVEYKDVKLIETEKGEKLKFTPPGSQFLDKQTLRNPRWLTKESAGILNKYLDFIDITSEHIIAWRAAVPKNWISDKIETVKNKSNNTDLEKNKDFYIPTKEDCEMAYTKPGEKIHVNKLLDKLHEELTKQGKVLDPKWRIITKKNIEKWSRSS